MSTTPRFKKAHVILLTGSILLFSVSVFAAKGNYYLGAEYGESTAKLSSSNPEISYTNGTTPVSTFTDAYPLNKTTSAKGLLSLKGGYEFLGAGWRPAIAVGLGFYTTPTSYKYTGQVNETVPGEAAETLYNYQFNVSSKLLMAETKFTWNLPHHIMPFVELGLGSAFNDMSAYSETAANSSGYVTLPGFQSKNNTNFAYQFGAGVGYGFNFKNFSANNDSFQHERISVGYRIANLGKASFNTRGAEYPYALKMGTLSTSEIYLNFTHLI